MARRHRNKHNDDPASRYEELIESILASAYRASSNPDSVYVERNASVDGSTRDERGQPVAHEIDIYLELRAPLVTHRIVVQAKYWRTRVKKEQVLTFAEILKDIPGQPRGIMVSRAGFQDGAIRYARAHGIELFLLQNLNESPKSVTNIAPTANSNFNYSFYPANLTCEREGVKVAFDFRSKLIQPRDVEVRNADGWLSIEELAEGFRARFVSDILHVPESVPPSGYRIVDFPDGVQYRINGSVSTGSVKTLRLEFSHEHRDAAFDFNVGESFEHYLSNVLTGKEWLIDLSGSSYEKEQIGFCDFCAVSLTDDQGTDFGCPDIILESTETRSNYALMSDWGACDQCADLVMNGDRAALEARACLLAPASGPPLSFMIGAIKQVQELFWQHYDGTHKPRRRRSSIEI